MTLAPGDLSFRLHTLHEQAHAELGRRDVFIGANLLVDSANEAAAEAGKDMEQYAMAMLNSMPSQARMALERAIKHYQTALVLCASAESTIGRKQRREVRIR